MSVQSVREVFFSLNPFSNAWSNGRLACRVASPVLQSPAVDSPDTSGVSQHVPLCLPQPPLPLHSTPSPSKVRTNCLTEPEPNPALALFSLLSSVLVPVHDLLDCLLFSNLCQLTAYQAFACLLTQEEKRSTHADRSRGRSVLMAGKSDWRGRDRRRDKVKHRNDFRTYGEDKHRGRRASSAEEVSWGKGEIINPVSSELFQRQSANHSPQICPMALMKTFTPLSPLLTSTHAKAKFGGER